MKATKQYYVYIMSNKSKTLYTGVTDNLERRVYEHKKKLIEGFRKKYKITILVYYEETTDIGSAIAREKQIKGWRRSKKIALIESMNPQWKDLSQGFESPGGREGQIKSCLLTEGAKGGSIILPPCGRELEGGPLPAKWFVNVR